MFTNANKILLAILFVLLLCAQPAIAAFSWYESFESYTSGNAYDPDSDGNDVPTDFEFDVNLSYADNSFNLVYSTEESITPRYGNKYFKMGATIDDCSTAYADAYKLYGVLEGPELSGYNHLNVNDNTEYWIGYSFYVPSDYFLERYDHGMWALTNDSAGACGSIGIYNVYGMGGTSDGVNADIMGSRLRNIGTSCSSYYQDFGTAPWTSMRGEWTDVVIHFVLHDTNNTNARMVTYINGVAYPARANGLANIPIGAGAYFSFSNYNDGLAHCANYDCTDGGGITAGYPQVYECSTDYVNPIVTWERALRMDEFRFTEQSIGTYNYCSVAPPIWAAAPTINSPSNGATGVSTTGTSVVYLAYADHRTDNQSCFTRDHTQVQVQATGGDWTNVIFESTTGGTVETDLQNLSLGETYDVRVRHYSVRSGTSETYAGEWSGVISFTTEGGDITSVSPTSLQACTADPQTVTMSLLTPTRNTYCRYSTNAAHTTYSAMSDQFTGGEGTTNHSVDLSRACDTTQNYYVICNDQVDGSGLDTERATITVSVDAAAAEKIPPSRIAYQAGATTLAWAADGITIAWLPAGEQVPDESPAEVIIDNGSAGTGYTGTWSVSGADGYYGGTPSLYSITTGGTYTFEASTPIGTYAVYEWHTVYSGTRERNPAASHAIYDGAVLEDTIAVDQQVSGGQWNLLGTYAFSTNGKVVITSPNSTYTTCADAIRFLKQ